MKKILTSLFIATIVSANLSAQSIDKSNFTVIKKTIPFAHIPSANRMLTGTDTTGLVDYTDFLPQFAPSFTPVIYGYTSGGYVYGNNADTINVCAQGYVNLNNTPIRVLGVLLWIGQTQSDAGSAPTSKVVVKAWGVSPNKAYNTDSSGTFNSTATNWAGPSTANNAPDESADLLFANIDTLNYNYLSFAVPPTYVGDFAVGVDFSTLAVGDTAGLVSDMANDAYNLDYAYHFYQNKWLVTDQMFSAAAGPYFGSGQLDNNIAIWAVIDTAQCYSHYTTTYDSLLNTFNLTVDPFTTAFAASYHWDFGDGSISTLPAPTHIYTVDSLYNVCLKTYTAAGDSCEYCHIIGIDSMGNVIRTTPGFILNVINPATVSVNDVPQNENTLSIYPNPSSNNITINFTSTSKNISVKIFDATGRLVRDIENVKSGENTINISNLQNGLYILNLQDGNNSITKRFVKL